jgi:hypothetical protein
MARLRPINIPGASSGAFDHSLSRWILWAECPHPAGFSFRRPGFAA